MQEYSKECNESYFFENDNNWFVSEKALHSAGVVMTVFKYDEKQKPQIAALLVMERLKLKFAGCKLVFEEYRKQLKAIMQEFFTNNGYSVFDETEAMLEFYKIINNYYNTERDDYNG